MTSHFLFALALVSGTLLWSQEARRAQSPISRHELCQAIAAELRQTGISEDRLPQPADIEMSVETTAAPVRSFRVAGACWDPVREMAQFRIECAQPGQCIPFLVHARIDRAQFDLFAANRGGLDASCRSTPPSAERHSNRPVVRPGDRAQVLFIGTHMRLSSAVTCLERGSEGDIIRVRNEDGHIFRARVSGPGLLEVVTP